MYIHSSVRMFCIPKKECFFSRCIEEVAAFQQLIFRKFIQRSFILMYGYVHVHTCTVYHLHPTLHENMLIYCLPVELLVALYVHMSCHIKYIYVASIILGGKFLHRNNGHPHMYL